jgi:CDGSH-type Zn-finger protein
MTEISIRARQNGPYLIPGPATLRVEGGEEQSVEQPTIALCRCGGSAGKPLCDGTHRKIDFAAPAAECRLRSLESAGA